MYVLVPCLIFLLRGVVGSACGLWDILDEVLLAPARGLDRRRLLDSLGAAAGKEEDAAEHRSEDTHCELSCANCQLLCFDSRSSFAMEMLRFAPFRVLLMLVVKGFVVRGFDVRSASRPCRWRGECSRQSYLR
jgi:hypothetical protein